MFSVLYRIIRLEFVVVLYVITFSTFSNHPLPHSSKNKNATT